MTRPAGFVRNGATLSSAIGRCTAFRDGNVAEEADRSPRRDLARGCLKQPRAPVGAGIE